MTTVQALAISSEKLCLQDQSVQDTILTICVGYSGYIYSLIKSPTPYKMSFSFEPTFWIRYKFKPLIKKKLNNKLKNNNDEN